MFLSSWYHTCKQAYGIEQILFIVLIWHEQQLELEGGGGGYGFLGEKFFLSANLIEKNVCLWNGQKKINWGAKVRSRLKNYSNNVNKKM